MTAVKTLNLPWNQHDIYWIALRPKSGVWPESVKTALRTCGLEESHDMLTMEANAAWDKPWQQIREHLQEKADAFEACVQGELAPTPEHFSASKRDLSAITAIAESLWLGEALKQGRVLCYLQPVMDANSKVFGYESFARVRMPDSTVRGGGAIVSAARALGVEYALDKLLHIQAIKTFAATRFSGFFFVNFFPGFIQRPEVYLEGLSETARVYGIIPKHIVLDFTHTEDHDLSHLKRVTDYCRAKGYALALDDIHTPAAAARLSSDIRPDFVKLDMHLSQQLSRATDKETVRQVVAAAHASGAMALAEGVETKESLGILRDLGCDLFQGYYFSEPKPVDALLIQRAG